MFYILMVYTLTLNTVIDGPFYAGKNEPYKTIAQCKADIKKSKVAVSIIIKRDKPDHRLKMAADCVTKEQSDGIIALANSAKQWNEERKAEQKKTERDA